jgi:L-fuconolactonase
MIIDAHQHFWDLSRADYHWLTPEAGVLYRNYLPEDLENTLRENDVQATVLIQAAASETETHYLLELAQAHSVIVGVIGWADFEAPDAPRRIALLAAAGGGRLKGLRPMIQDIPDPTWITRPTLDAAFEALIAHDLAFDALVKPMHLDGLRTRLLRHPKLRAVLDHAGKPDIANGGFAVWAEALERLARDTTSYCKLSGLLTEAAPRTSTEEFARYVAHVFSSFGPERMLWGSDWPVLTSISTYARWLALSQEFVTRFAAGHRDAIMGKTAHRFYRLTPKLSGEGARHDSRHPTDA